MQEQSKIHKLKNLNSDLLFAAANKDKVLDDY